MSRTRGSIACNLVLRNGAGSSASPQCRPSCSCLPCLVSRAVLDGWLCKASWKRHYRCFGLLVFPSQKENLKRLWLRFIRSERQLVILYFPGSTSSLSSLRSLSECSASCLGSTRFSIT